MHILAMCNVSIGEIDIVIVVDGILTPPIFLTHFNALGEDALPNGLDVTFEVTELKRLTGSYNTMVGNNEGSMVRGSTYTFSSIYINTNQPQSHTLPHCT